MANLVTTNKIRELTTEQYTKQEVTKELKTRKYNYNNELYKHGMKHNINNNNKNYVT